MKFLIVMKSYFDSCINVFLSKICFIGINDEGILVSLMKSSKFNEMPASCAINISIYFDKIMVKNDMKLCSTNQVRI